MITYKSGNIFESEMQTITNPINIVGVMGKGLAEEFKKRYPEMFDDYVFRCAKNKLKMGEPYCWNALCGGGKWILNFPTKRHWRNSSKLKWIERGLIHLKLNYKNWKIESLAITPLGCGLGGLNWDDVRIIMERHLKELDIPVEIYSPVAQR